MKTSKFILIILISIFIFNFSFAQKDTTDKITKFRIAYKKKLIEQVGLTEQTAEKYLDLQTEYRNKIRDIATKRKELKEYIENNPEATDISKKLDELFSLEDEAYKNRKAYINSLKEILTPEQIAKTMKLQKETKKLFKEKNKEKNKKKN